jgi:Type II secretion system (T2SS), protein F
LTKALESAAQESRPPLREQLDEVTGRIHFGDDAQAVFRSLTERVPLETFLLFSSALSVHWEVGGSLAPTLATVGRTIRDRIARLAGPRTRWRRLRSEQRRVWRGNNVRWRCGRRRRWKRWRKQRRNGDVLTSQIEHSD